MRHSSFILLAALGSASAAKAQTALHYWNFTTPDDVIGGLATTEVGAPDLSLHPIYGEAYPGAGASLNNVVGGTSMGGGHLSADTHDGVAATALDFGTSNFAVSYWSYSAADGDPTRPMIFDFLAGDNNPTAQVGMHVAAGPGGNHIIRFDDDLDTTAVELAPTLQANNTWTQVCINVDRGNGAVSLFFDGVSVNTFSIAALTGNLFATQDLLIGAINSGAVPAWAQQGGLDDLAFYDGLLGSSDIAGLAAGTLTPPDIAPLDPNFCFGDGTGAACPCGNPGPEGAGCANSTGTGAVITTNGDTSVMNNALTFDMAGGTASTFAVLLSGDNALGGGLGILGLPAKDGLRCVGGGLLRHGTRGLDASGANSDPWGSFTGPAGGIIGGAGFAAGQTRYFQARYREAPSLAPCGTDQNTSQGIELTFTL